MTAAATTTAPPPASPTRRRVLLALRLGVTCGAVAYLLGKHPPETMWSAITSLSGYALVYAVLVLWFALVVGTVRWGILMSAYGASTKPPFLYLLRVYFVGMFYNTYVPGGVGGDVIRGVVTRRAFEREGATGAVAVVFVERVLGLAGLLALTAGSLVLRPLNDNPMLIYWSLLGLVGAFGLVLGLAIGRRLAPWLPGFVGRIAASLPQLQRPGPFFVAALLSVCTHTLIAFVGHILVSSISDAVTLLDSFTVVPLAGAAAFFPLSVGGLGVREAAFDKLYAMVGVPEELAVAAALAFLVCQLIAAAAGGILHILSPLEMKQPVQDEP